MKYKMKQFMKADISKFYILVVGIISLLLIGGFFSYAMFTVSKEKDNAINIVTGNLTALVQVDGTESNTLTVDANTIKTFTVTLSNPNNRIARFNFYYEGSLSDGVKAGYLTGDGLNTPPAAPGINLEQADTSGSSNTYSIKVINSTDSSVTITLGVSVGLDYNDLSLPENGHLFEEIKTTGPVGDVIVDNISTGNIYDDETDTFITGEDPNSYIWYSGKLWRAVSVNNEEKTVKLVTEWNISTTNYDDDSNAFAGSYMEEWLNDTTEDGFLGNLRDYENFIVTDAKWNATEITSDSKPPETTIVTDAVGLLNYYEYVTSYRGTDYSNGYLNNGLWWWMLTPFSTTGNRYVDTNGTTGGTYFSRVGGVRPSINLKSIVQIVSGDGTIDNPYRLAGDSDTELSGTLLNTRYSGEYITFGTGENNLYRIVSHETSGLTKITSAEPLKDSVNAMGFVTSAFSNTSSETNYSSANTIGTFLNGEYLTNYVGDNYSNMIEDNTTWYLGTVGDGTSYKLAKYTDVTGNTLTSSTTSAKVGLLRYGELMSGQFNGSENNVTFWLLTPHSSTSINVVNYEGNITSSSPSGTMYGIRPTLSLKSNVEITGGTGTKSDPFTVQLAS